MRLRQAGNIQTTTLICFALLGGVAGGQETVTWKVGPAFQRQMEANVGITWPSRPLGAALGSLSQSAQVVIFLDRRIDPDQVIDITLREQPLDAALAQIATAINAELRLVGSVVYVGPSATASVLPTVAALRRQQAERLPGNAKTRLLREESWRWPELSEPRRLLESLSGQAGVAIENPQAIPHDLWPAVSLPPLSWIDRMSLLLAGFGLTFEMDDRGLSVRLVPLPESAVIEKTYTPRGRAQDSLSQLLRVAPEAKARVEQGKLIVSAIEEDHERIARLLSGADVASKSKAKNAVAEKRYSLQVANEPAGAVVRTLANQLGKEIKYDAAALAKLRQNVNFNVKDVTLDELLKTTLGPLGLSYKLSDAALEIVVAK